VVKIVSFGMLRMERVVVIIDNFSMSGMSFSQNAKLHYVWYVLYPKLSVSAWMGCVMVKILSFSMSGMSPGINCQFQHG
jgi:hypothetical protein